MYLVFICISGFASDKRTEFICCNFCTRLGAGNSRRRKLHKEPEQVSMIVKQPTKEFLSANSYLVTNSNPIKDWTNSNSWNGSDMDVAKETANSMIFIQSPGISMHQSQLLFNVNFCLGLKYSNCLSK